MLFLYNLFLIVLYPFFLIFLLWADRRHPRYMGTARQRLGRFAGFPPRTAGVKRVWIHAVSVGEASGAEALMNAMKERDGGRVEAVVSTSTIGGMTFLEKRTKGLAAALFYFPLDFPWIIRRALTAADPDAIVILETELWPNVIEQARRGGIPCLLLNARVSDRMAAAWGPALALHRKSFASLSVIGAQYERDGDRLLKLGAPAEKVATLGNIKLDGMTAAPDPKRIESLKNALGEGKGPLLLAGSTHPGEEEQMLGAFAAVLARHPEARLILCPRHVDRAAEVEKLCRERGFPPVLRSAGAAESEWRAMVLDTTGELSFAYALCDAAFVGGTLIPRGGHNLLEPAARGKAPFYGPSVENFITQAERLERAGAGVRVTGPGALADALLDYLDDPEKKAERDRRALELALEDRGAAGRAWAATRAFLEIE